MKVEGLVSSLRNAETIEDLFSILKKKGAPIIDLEGIKKLIIVEGDFEGKQFYTEINGMKANLALGDAMLNSANVPFKCKKPFTGGNLILVDLTNIESKEFVLAYRDDVGVYFHVKEGEAKEISKEEYDNLKNKMPEFIVKGLSEEEAESMGAFFG
ncbi:hypothetical protein [Pyrococcus horikoshii]|uniref:Uncharacterized protein n=2 Tax=Pyrococcus horikoshii TaxID=53953 RepID=O58940_PYRHO|nr:hypothetical protein [Pyrococcus horikoshii]BAA30343.1 155aa long hypothetical protein [Pyrococcus horikoshii OT3]HII60255.1 hypothetical protein [Pyrococcus horikoshii]